MIDEKELEKVERAKAACGDIVRNLLDITLDLYYNLTFLTNEDIGLLTKTVFENMYLVNHRKEKEIRNELEKEKDAQKKIKLSEELFESMLYRGAVAYARKGYIDELLLEEFDNAAKQERRVYINLENNYPENHFIPEINRIFEKQAKVAYYLNILRNYISNETVVEGFRKSIIQDEFLDLYNNYMQDKTPETKEKLEKMAKKSGMGRLLKNLE